MGYGKIASYFIVLSIGWTLASWYYGEEIAQINLKHKTALVEAVTRAVEQHNALANEDRSFMETFFEEKNENDSFFTKTTEDIKNVKHVTGCFVSPELKRLWNAANKGRIKALSSRTDSLHGAVQKRIAKIQPNNTGSPTVFKGGSREPHFKREGILFLPKKTQVLSRLD